MKRAILTIWALALLFGLASSATAQQVALSGEVRDKDGNVWVDLRLVFKSEEFGTTFETQTDKKGAFTQAGVRTGIYVVTFFRAKADKSWEKVYEMRFRVASGDNYQPMMVNFKEIVASEGKEVAEARKKQEEEGVKFENMKTHFDAGKLAYDQIKPLKDQIQKAPADQRAPLVERLNQLHQTAINEFREAQRTSPEKESNLHTVMYMLGKALDSAAMYEEAAAAFQKAAELKPTQVEYLMEVGTALARTDKVTEAGAECDKAIPVNKSIGAKCWANVGIVLWQKNKMKEAVPVLRRAVELDAKNAQAWYVLGSALVNTMGYRQEGGKIIPELQPGTVEAYQKCVELDPSGTFGAQAKEGLEQLKAMGVGIDTKVKAAKKKQ